MTVPPDDLAGYTRPTGRFGGTVRYLPETGSTNDIALEAARARAPEGLLVLADRQIAGRGRLKRRWLAPAGSSLLLSLLFRPRSPFAWSASRATMACGLSLLDAVRLVTGQDLRLKWPNDLIAHPPGDPLRWYKLAGMLSEIALDDAGKPEALIVGIGLNVNISAADLASLAPNAGSLSALVGSKVSRTAVLDAFLTRLDVLHEALLAGQDPYLDWSQHLAWIGLPVTIQAGDETVIGEALGVDSDGALLVGTPSGTRRFSAGDVTLRPAV